MKSGFKKKLFEKKYISSLKHTYKVVLIFFSMVFFRVSPTGFLESDLYAKLEIDEFLYEFWNSIKKIQCLLYKNKI